MRAIFRPLESTRYESDMVLASLVLAGDTWVMEFFALEVSAQSDKSGVGP